MSMVGLAIGDSGICPLTSLSITTSLGDRRAGVPVRMDCRNGNGRPYDWRHLPFDVNIDVTGRPRDERFDSLLMADLTVEDSGSCLRRLVNIDITGRPHAHVPVRSNPSSQPRSAFRQHPVTSCVVHMVLELLEIGKDRPMDFTFWMSWDELRTRGGYTAGGHRGTRSAPEETVDVGDGNRLCSTNPRGQSAHGLAPSNGMRRYSRVEGAAMAPSTLSAP
ncbi:hypothetical protein NEOLEDRAFT_1177288 [Neolentinus lepideus HHB14362 ss-1]|uniref:Uncharacterized protein n=1 Tax=Neolentinus lepideus HHB14362 ss-1 TaxID=1314782 RepID=A0A165TI12_9AGAM|nr:hypothetical protein NEOLEDRAFT_1177288 [Neolentinus lepideus HHB14362 ss-1]